MRVLLVGRCTAATGLVDTERHIHRAGQASASRTAARAEHLEQEHRMELKERSTADRKLPERWELRRTAERSTTDRKLPERRELRRTAERRAHHRARHRMSLEHCSARRTATCCKQAVR